MTQVAMDFMEAKPDVCFPGDSVVQAAQLMEQEDCGMIPIVDNEDSKRVLGVLTDRDIVVRLIAQNRNPMQAKVEECMTKEVKTLPPSASMSDVAQLMQDAQIRRICIVDANGRLVGVVAQADVATEAQPPRLVAETVDHISRPANA